MKTTKEIRVNALAAAVLVSLLSGCAQDVDEIDRTQNNIIDKKDLVGEWYFKRTVSDAPMLSAYSFEGDQSPLDRGTFEIQEGSLYFYRTYEFSRNSQAIGFKNDVDTPYLAWLPGDEAAFTPNPYQSSGLRYAEGDAIGDADGKTIACGGETVEDGDMHDFCHQTGANEGAFCGHDKGTAAAERSAANAVCVYPTKFVFRGAPLAAWPIDSHFDMKYEYNTTTGEPTNVLVENDDDRVWYDREFMRVAWGENAVLGYQFTLAALINDVIVSPFQGDAAPEGQEFRIFRNAETSVPDYIDFVSPYILAAPASYDDYYEMDIPLCLYYPWYSGGVFECTSEEVLVRHAFLKVDPNDQYVPLKYDDQLMDKFGYFRQERQNYDPMYETTYTGIIRFIERHDIWANHVVNADGTEDYSKMEPKPIVYYLSVGFPRNLVPEAMALAKEWAQPFNDVVAFLKGKDAVPKKGMFVVCENNNTEAQAAKDASEPYAETDLSVCKDMNYVKYNGDIRYSFLHSANKPSMAGLLGFGPSSADPLTGKTVSATAHIYTAGVTLEANTWADRIEALVGFKDYMTTAEGMDKAFEQYPEKLAIGYNPPPKSEEDARLIASKLVSDEVKTRIGEFGVERTDMDFASMRMGILKQDPALEASMLSPALAAWQREPAASPKMEFSTGMKERLALRNWANYKGIAQKREVFQKLAMNRMEFAAWYDYAFMGVAEKWRTKYDVKLCGEVLAKADAGELALPFDVNVFNITKEPCSKEQEGKVRSLDAAPRLHYYEVYNPSRPEPGDTCQFVDQGGAKGYFWVNTCSTAKLGTLIANQLQFTEGAYEYDYWKPSPWYMDTQNNDVAKFQEVVRGIGKAIRAEMVSEFEKLVFLSVSIHEVGHTLGLRHNFEASTDAMNFKEDYWKLRVEPSTDGKSFVPLGLWTDMTELQTNSSMTEWQYSSIMDYGAKYNDLLHGIGLYDSAAIKFGYGGMVEVFKDAPDLSGWAKYLADPDEEGTPGSTPPVKADANLLERLFRRVHYTQIPNVLGGVDKIYDREDVLFSDIKGEECASDADCGGNQECRTQLNAKYCSPKDKVEVPYRFCGDEYVQRTPTCDVWDIGVDPYEIVRNTVNDYWWLWMFYGHWRGNPLYDGFGAPNYTYRIAWLFNRMKAQFQWWAIEYARLNNGDWWEKSFGKRYEEDLNGGLSGAMATYEAFNTLTSTFSIPSGNGLGWPQVYVYSKLNDRYETFTSYNDEKVGNYFFLEEDYGRFGPRPMYPSYHFEANGLYAASGGALYDRLQALVALTDPTTDFLYIDEFPDTQKYLISFFTFFPDQLIGLLGGVVTHRTTNYGACVVEGEKSKPQYLKLRTALEMGDDSFCSDGHFLEPEEVDNSFDTTWYQIPIMASFYGMALMTNDYDNRFLDSTRVFLKGHETAVEYPEGTEVAEFRDPFSGKIYVAAKLADPSVFSTAYYLVTHANQIMDGFDTIEELQNAWLNGNKAYGANDVKKVVGILEIMRTLHNLYDFTAVPPMVVEPTDE